VLVFSDNVQLPSFARLGQLGAAVPTKSTFPQPEYYSEFTELSSTRNQRFVISDYRVAMKPENPAATPDAAIVRVPSPTDQSNEKRSDKKLKFMLESGHSASAVVLRCQGRIIFHSEARALSTIVADVLPSARRMVVDLTEVDAVDSGGLGELVLTHMWAEAAGYTLKFASPEKSVRHLFEITHLVSVLDVYASVPEAMAAMVREEVQST